MDSYGQNGVCEMAQHRRQNSYVQLVRSLQKIQNYTMATPLATLLQYLLTQTVTMHFRVHINHITNGQSQFNKISTII